MKVYEKIRQLLKEKGWKLNRLHNEIAGLFEDSAVSYRTLLRTVHGETHLRESTLFQVASVLGITPQKIRQGTDEEEKVQHYSYNKKAHLEIMPGDQELLTARLVLLPDARTETEQDPAEKGDFVKWLYGLQGEITCVVDGEDGEERHVIGKNESFYFRSTKPHHFENHTMKKSIALLIQNPKYI